MAYNMFYSSPTGHPAPVETINYYTPPHDPRPINWNAPQQPQYVHPPMPWSAPQPQFSSPSGPWTSPYLPSNPSPLREARRPPFFPQSPEEHHYKPVWSAELGVTHWHPKSLQEHPGAGQLPFVGSTSSINHGQATRSENPFMPHNESGNATRYEAMASQSNPVKEMHSRASAGRYFKKKDFQDRLRRSRTKNRDDRIENQAEKADYLQAKQAREAQLRREAQMQDVNRQQLEFEAMAETEEPMFDEEQEVNALAETYYKEQERKKEFIELQKDFPDKTIEEIEYLAGLWFPMGYQEGEFDVTPEPGWKTGNIEPRTKKQPVVVSEQTEPDDAEFDMEDDIGYEEAFQQALSGQQW